MNRLDRHRVRAFLETAPWQPVDGRLMATVWLERDAIRQDCFPASIGIVEILWSHVSPDGLVPVRIVKNL